MADPDQTLHATRRLVEEVVGQARELLLSGTDVKYVQSHYVIAATELLGEAETLAILTVSGDREAPAALEKITSRLPALRDQARAELDQSDR